MVVVVGAVSNVDHGVACRRGPRCAGLDCDVSGKGSRRRPQAVSDTTLEDRWGRTFRYRVYRIFHAGRKAYWRVYDHELNKVQSEHFGLGSEKLARMTADDLNAA